MNRKKKGFAMPHTYVILVIMLIISMVLSWFIPSGEYERIEDVETGRIIVVEGSYKPMEKEYVTPFQAVGAIAEGMVESSDIIFFILFAYGMVYMLIKSGAFFGGIAQFLKVFNGKEAIMLPILMFLFALAGSTVGISEEFYGIIPVFVGIGIAMGYDGLVGGSIICLSMAVGFSANTTNPFSIGIAQSLAGLPMMSGMIYRIIIFLVFTSLSIFYVMRYAKKVKENPELSLVKDVNFGHLKGMSREEMDKLPFTNRHKILLGIFVLSIVLMVLGTIIGGWYLRELSALFIIMMVIIGLVAGFNFSEISNYFLESVGEIIFGALVVGLARSIMVVLTEANIIDSVVFYTSNLLLKTSKYIGAVGMLLFQNLLNFFITSNSGQAAVAIPLMAPIGDMIGLTRQTTVLAYTFGAGFSDIFWPTGCAVMCGLMGVPMDKWYKFITPLFLMMVALEIVFLLLAVWFGYGPF
ncbi:YfcC family protein [Anaerosphaera multitolerans]|uniref:YfcC family protein n=1 Tax=Anaerosphaera multitolerans TaxID=2487351 RepID=UPI00196A22B1|nr:YfcC family protein [Anaerosphaera multitolerans]